MDHIENLVKRVTIEVLGLRNAAEGNTSTGSTALVG